MKIDRSILNTPIQLASLNQFTRVEKILDCDCFYLEGYISFKVISTLVDELSERNSIKSNITIIIKSNGGFANYEDKTIKELLLKNQKNKNLCIIINEYVTSAGSVLALSSDELYFANEYSGMGCIDPRIPNNNYISVFDKYGRDLLIDVDKKHCLIKEIKVENFNKIKSTFYLTHKAITNGNIFVEKKFKKQFLSFMGLTKEIDYTIYHSKPISATRLIYEIGLNATIIEYNSELFNAVNSVIEDAEKIRNSIKREVDFFALSKNMIFY